MQYTLSFFATILQKDFDKFCNEKLEKLGLSKGLLYFVLYVGKHPGCSPGNLSEELHFDSGHTTRAIDKLEKAGFLIREKNEQDKRAYLLELTEKGKDAFKASYHLFLEWDKKILANISEVEREQLISLLKKLDPIKGEFFYV